MFLLTDMMWTTEEQSQLDCHMRQARNTKGHPALTKEC